MKMMTKFFIEAILIFIDDWRDANCGLWR